LEIVDLEKADSPIEIQSETIDPMVPPAFEEITSGPPVAEEDKPTVAGTPSPEPEVPQIELVDETPSPEHAPVSAADFELELKPETGEPLVTDPRTTEDFLSELAAEVEDMQAPALPESVHTAPGVAENTPEPAAARPHLDTLDQLAEVFQEFRNELGEFNEETEDLETHYNLGIAYREMGLLDEAIGEFQKVAKAVQNGSPFRYAMNCSTLLALSFMDKGEPKIAAMWYRRALETPGLDPETILALRYDLGVSLEIAGESPAALDSFRQVYAMNIDYRDVADRIATLQKV
jgi:tetratricopeptide (TPR) repeat protein